MRKLLLTIMACLSLTACVQKAKTINDVVSGNVQEGTTANSSATPTAETNDYSVTAPADETEPVEGENEDIAYKTGDFEALYARLQEEYPSGYQSFDKDSLLDLYGDGETDFFSDGIGYVSQEDGCYNQLFVLNGLDSETGETFVKNITGVIDGDPSISDFVEYEVYDWEDVTVISIGEQEFLNNTRKMVEDLFSGAHSEAE